jgi:hypothetical protein
LLLTTDWGRRHRFVNPEGDAKNQTEAEARRNEHSQHNGRVTSAQMLYDSRFDAQPTVQRIFAECMKIRG